MKKILLVCLSLSVINVCLSSPILLADDGQDWWESGNFYQIYPRSFKDTNGDGVGDLLGITEKLLYLKTIGVTGIWLSPIYTSPMADFGYDISNFIDIQPEYGSMRDFERLTKLAKLLGIRVILDFVPNHSSDEHEWFRKSAARDPEYKDYYIWHPGKVVNGTRSPPNNWLSVFRYSAWEWNEQRQEYYYHAFVDKQPDLNYRNPKVVEAMKNVLRFWLERGVSGFRIDAVPHLFEIAPDANGTQPDEPLSNACADPDSYCYLNHIHTQNQNETFDMVYQWREVMDSFKRDHGGETRILMTEAYADLDTLMRFYGDGKRNGSQIPFNFELIQSMNLNSTALNFKNAIESWLNKMPKNTYANWVLGNHDNKRLASRLGPARVDLFNILLKTLPGVAITYNGEEIGMEDVRISWEDTLDPQACNTNPQVYHENSRDPARTPFQWNDNKNAGFSNANITWLPVGPNYRENNVKNQLIAPRSHLKVFMELLKLRKEPSLRSGTYEPKLIGDQIYIYKRAAPGNRPYVIVLNFGKVEGTVDLQTLYNNTLTNRLEVVTSSIHSLHREGDIIESKAVHAEAETGLVLTII